MPEGNMLYVHLKDKSLIRNKKRWSQVSFDHVLIPQHEEHPEPIRNLNACVFSFQIMYLYYLLGFKGYNVKNPQKITVSLFVFLFLIILQSCCT